MRLIRSALSSFLYYGAPPPLFPAYQYTTLDTFVNSMDDKPYTTPEEDPFNIQPCLQPRRRRSSLLNKWIQEQQNTAPPESDISSGKLLSPYLAYPDLGTWQGRSSHCGSAITLASYDLVDDEDIPQNLISEPPITPVTPSSHKSFLGTPTTFRSLHLSFRSQSPARSVTPTSGTPSRKSFLPLSSRLGTSSERSVPKQHNRSSSLSVLNTPPSPSKWRPSVLGYFSSSQVSVIPSETLYTPSRPSVSSNSTVTTITTTTSATATVTDNEAVTSKFNGITSIRSRERPYVAHSRENSLSTSPSAFHTRQASLRKPLGPKSGVQLANSNVDYPLPDDEDDDEQLRTAVHAPKRNAKPEVAFSSSPNNTLSKMSFAALTKNTKKKRLIISGISPNDTRKFEGIKRWCESFGEITHIIRMPNGDLHVHFRSADVADTVCRLRAKVYIVGCGSVGVSWATGSAKR
ncbi:hypothetical protein BDP27DRAFT_1533324 [Rhodocollybia butyracea]|uniref:Uncharacterized protein n=1 Tax=Rhodocollybia butyracea TaxID=206335 RepID=A0A9P5Q0T7_9AGAR|nr:hypothetical protein BDP27DRAFT_1533324 [Rhodocollybia butyracea]